MGNFILAKLLFCSCYLITISEGRILKFDTYTKAC